MRAVYAIEEMWVSACKRDRWVDNRDKMQVLYGYRHVENVVNVRGERQHACRAHTPRRVYQAHCCHVHRHLMSARIGSFRIPIVTYS